MWLNFLKVASLLIKDFPDSADQLYSQMEP